MEDIRKIGEFSNERQRKEVIKHLKSMDASTYEVMVHWSKHNVTKNAVSTIKTIKSYLMDQFDISEEELEY